MNNLKEYEKKYYAQKEVTNHIVFEQLDPRTLRACIRAFLVNTANECIKAQIGLETEQKIITPLSQKESRNRIEELKLTNEKTNLRVILEYKEIVDDALCDLIELILINDNFKLALADDMPEVFDSLYSLVGLEEYVINNILDKICEMKKKLNFSDICKIINEGILDTTNNAELLVDHLKKNRFYSEFVNLREKKKMKL